VSRPPAIARVTSIAALAALACAAAPVAAQAKPPKLTIADAGPRKEPVAGAQGQAFKVSIDRKKGKDVTFTYATEDRTATTAGPDYNGDFGTGLIPAGKRSTLVIIGVLHDFAPEPTERYALRLSDPHGARLSGDTVGIGTIKDGNLHESEPNNQPATANPLDPPATSMGAQLPKGDTDLFVLTPSYNGSEFAYTGGYGKSACTAGSIQIDTKITVFDGQTQVASNDDYSGSGTCSQTSWAMTSGHTYFIVLEHGATLAPSGFGYTLTVGTI
jgi:hypothetical protein